MAKRKFQLQDNKMKKQSRRKFIITSLIAVIFSALYPFWFESYLFASPRFRVTGKKSFGGYKILQVSDIHIQSVNTFLKRIARKINRIQPDLIVVTGDSVDRQRNMSELKKFLGLISKDIPKIAITGNWEYWGRIDLEELRSVYEDHNCKLLINEHHTIQVGENTILVSGLDDYIGGKQDFSILSNLPIDPDFHIVLAHCPQQRDFIEMNVESSDEIDLILSGHTHGGQVNLLGYIPFIPNGSGEYISGWYKEAKPHLYVSKGIGTSIHPVRFGARAEIATFELV
jgi:predicted MPP superfamily phosphohydrolase